IAYLGKFGSEISRGVFILFVVLTPASVLVARATAQAATRRAVNTRRVHHKRILLIGEAREVHNPDLLRRLGASGYQVSEIVETSFEKVQDAPAHWTDHVISRVREEP
ncbi:hypothetical protein ACLBYF_34075, partial [Methylobacterium brachiatum]